MTKIPKHAKEVFKGVLYSVHHWEQELFDGTIKTFEMLKRNGGCGIVCVTKEKKIIFLNEEQPNRTPFPSMPGGCVDDGETDFLEVAKRELLEETGYVAKEWNLLWETLGSTKLHMPEHVYIAKNSKKVSDLNLDAGEKIEVNFCDFDEFLQLCRNPLFQCPPHFKFYLYECLLDENKKEEFRQLLFN